jgi:predicted XRE-type DNA-binding protein
VVASKIHNGSGNVFIDVGFDLGTAESLRVRTDLMITIEQEIVARGLTQAKAAALFGTSQRRLNDLTRGRIDRLSIDTLVAMLGHAGISVQLVTPRMLRLA